MNTHRLLHTTAMRLALRYSLFYAVLIALGLGLLYLSISQYINTQIAVGLEQEAHKLDKLDRKEGRQKLKNWLLAQSINSGDSLRHYLLLENNKVIRFGALLDWPPQLNADGKVNIIWVEDELIHGHGEDQDGYWPMIAIKLNDGSRLLISQSIKESAETLEFILATMVAILVMSVFFSLVMGWRLGLNVLERIDRINETAHKVTVGDFSKRVSISGQDDEFDELATHLNKMLERIESLLAGMRQVSDNVAHDLRKPLARIRNRIEVILLEERQSKEYRLAMEETMRDADELMGTFNALLEIAQAEAGSFRGEWDTVDLTSLLQRLAELYQDQAEIQQQEFRATIEPELTVDGNRHLIAQAVSNLLDNAFKYTNVNGCIQLEAKMTNSMIHVSVCDDGSGIPEDKYNMVLQRFVRLEAARSSHGNGLGLSLVKAVAELHHASLHLENNHPGLCVKLIFSACH